MRVIGPSPALLLAALSLALIGGALLACEQPPAPVITPAESGSPVAAGAPELVAGSSERIENPTPVADSSQAPSLIPSQTPVAGTSSVPSADASQAPTAIPTQMPTPLPDNRFALLLLGYGGGGHDGAYLTDAMMVLIVDPDQKTVTMLSLPRDLWVPLNFDGSQPVYNKVNTAYAFARDSRLYPQRLPRYRGDGGAGRFAKDTVAHVLGIPIDYYLALDFQAFRDLIDAVGGVDVVVPASFTAQYPRHDSSSIDPGWMMVSFRAGPQHLNGERALQFARAREVVDNSAEGSDFARARRQRLILMALKDQLFQPSGLIHLPQVLGIVQRSADTDYPLLGVGDLAKLALAWSEVQVYQAGLSLSNYLKHDIGSHGEYILVPRQADGSWEAVQAFARQLRADPALGEAMAAAPVVVVNRTGRSVVARETATHLSALGYVVTRTDAGPVQYQTVIRDRSGGRAARLVEALSQHLGLQPAAVVLEQADRAPKVVVELGLDALGISSASASP